MTHLPNEESNKGPNEEKLRSYYESFGGDHDRLRSKLLAALSVEAVPAQEVVMPNRTGGRKLSWLTFPRLAPRLASRWAIAALLFVAIGLSMLHQSGTTQTVYGMEHLAERLLAVRSLHVKGWMYQKITTEEGEEKVEKFPIERYFRRPDCIGFTSYGFTSPGDGTPTQVSRAYTASNGKQIIAVSHKDKTAKIATAQGDPFYVELLVESFIQSSEAKQFLQGPPEEYRKIRSEEIDGVMCDLYFNETQFSELHPMFSRSKHFVWLNPLTGIPAKAERTIVDKEGNEDYITSETIRVNVEPPASLFSFQAPEGYQVDRENTEDLSMSGTKLSYVGAGCSDTTWLATWHSFRIDDRAALVCWHQYDTDKDKQKQWFARQPEFELYQGDQSRACSEQTITTNQVGDKQWRWSLIRPDDGKPLGEELLRFGVSGKKGRTSQELKPLRFPEKRLQEIILEAQRRSLPDDTSKRLFTLEELRTRLQAKP